MRTIIFHCDSDGVSISGRTVTDKKTSKRKHLGKARTIAGMRKLFKRINLNDDTDIVMFSSSMDFPDEYTKDKDVLKLVKKLQGDRWEKTFKAIAAVEGEDWA